MSESSGEEEEIIPPWGALPVEAYILHHWDAGFAGQPAEQLRTLVRDYVQASPSAALPAAIPTKLQVDTILRPWRTALQRDIATYPSATGCVWLRTAYGADTDAAHEELHEHIDMFMALDDEDRLLNDEELYDFGDDWRQILDVMPELVTAFRRDDAKGDWTSFRVKAEDELVRAKAYLAGEEVDGGPIAWIDKWIGDKTAAEVEESVLGVLRTRVHEVCVVNYIIVEDKEALETKQVLIVFLDAKGRVVRWSRHSPSDAEQMGGAWFDGCWAELNEFAEGKLGDDYQAGGVCGHLLHL